MTLFYIISYVIGIYVSYTCKLATCSASLTIVCFRDRIAFMSHSVALVYSILQERL
jgi:hypothetical protein